MIQKIPIDQFIQLSKSYPVFDVRTPSEFYKGHIPGANNLPLFNDEERAVVGTIYNKQGREKAILQGLDFVGPRMRSMVECIEKTTTSRTLLIHCWRGGMRSGSVAWLVNFFGYEIFTLDGGYKSFRNFVLAEFEKKRNFIVIGGKTGSGKSSILTELKAKNNQVLDLEKIANHKGSAFGSIGMPEQPRQEHFENLIAAQLFTFTNDQPIYVEDESRKIGGLQIPNPLWDQMRNSPVINLEVPIEERINHLVEEYGKGDLALLGHSILKIRENLGGSNAKEALDLLGQNDLEGCCRILLAYYDKTYLYGLSQRNPESVHTISLNKIDSDTAIQLIQNISSVIKFSKEISGG